MSDHDDELTTKARYACRRSALAILRAALPASMSTGEIQVRIWSKWRFALGAVLADLVADGSILRQPSYTGYRYRLNGRRHGERWCHRCRIRPPLDDDRYCRACRMVVGNPPAITARTISTGLQPITLDNGEH